MRNHHTVPTFTRLRVLAACILAALSLASPWPDTSLPAEPTDLESPRARRWSFDDAAPRTLPSSFVIGTLFDGRPAGE